MRFDAALTDVGRTRSSKEQRRRSIRIRGYDYSEPGAYFVTLCVYGQECILGEVVDGQVRLLAAGQVVRDVWLGLLDRFEKVRLDEFVVMPNHVHGILVFVATVATAVGAIPR